MHKETFMRIQYALIIAAAALVPVLAQTPKSKPGADWPMYNRDLAGTRYSPLTQVNTTNVANLKMAWSYRLSNAPTGRGAASPADAPAAAGGRGAGGRGGGRGNAPAPTVNPEATPIVINGVMYLPAGGRVLALEAESGKLIWEYKLPTGSTSARGVAYWPGEGTTPPRILFTAGKQLRAINQLGVTRGTLQLL